jgi:serine acetyltransferase
MVPRMILNPSLHAVVIIRLSNAGPRWLHWFWRNLMIWKHSMDIGYRPEIGPGLVLAHPFGIAISNKVRIGEGVRIMHNVSIGPKVGDPGVPMIGDGALLLTGCMLFGGIEIGAGSIIGAGSFVDFDVPAGSAIRTSRGELLEGRARELNEQIV